MNRWIDAHPRMSSWLVLVLISAMACLPTGRPWVYVTDAAFYGGLALLFHYSFTERG